ncbi:unnamed protein product, partial [Allacma fusca]
MKILIRLIIGLVAVTCALTLTSPLGYRVKRWGRENYPSFELNFDCRDRPVGFYADVEHDCQVFHMCDADGVRIPHICPNDTAFHQQYRVCDWAYNVDCQDSPNWKLRDLSMCI